MKLFDLHSDLLTQTKTPYQILSKISSDYTICLAVYNDNLTKENFIKIVNNYSLKKPKNTLLCFEDIGYNFLFVEDIIKYKPFYVQLTYNDENKYGYGCNFNNALKPLGIDAVKQLSDNNIYVDVAHLSEKGALMVCELTNKVICSHALFKGVYNHKRNLSKTLIKEIVNNGGVIGACLVNYFVAGDNDARNELGFFKHIDYFLQNFGDENLAISTDFYGSDNFVNKINVYSKIPLLEKLFLKYGYSTKTIEKIFYKNAIKLLK